MAAGAKKFSYFKRLGLSQKNIYNKSDAITHLKLPQAERFEQVLHDLKTALEKEDAVKTKIATARLVNGLTTVFGVPQIHVKVLNKRPSMRSAELHGLYVFEAGKQIAITVWMRTAKRKETVAYKTFLRTIVHEFVHHLDFTFFKFADSFHTKGFYQRESSILKQLLNVQ